MVIKARFKIYENIVCDDKRDLYQLEHFTYRRTKPFKKLTYNEKRKAYRINSQWVSKKRLYKFMYLVDEEIEINDVVPEYQKQVNLMLKIDCLENSYL